MSLYSIPAVRAGQNGHELYLYFIPAKTLKALPIKCEQFRTINSTAKGVPTALVNAILAKLHATEGDEAIDVSAHRNVVCYKVTEALNNDPDSPWHKLIALPNQSQWTKKEINEDPAREH